MFHGGCQHFFSEKAFFSSVIAEVVVMAETEPKKHTEQDLRNLGVGKYVDTHDRYEWDKKKSLYYELQAWEIFARLREDYRLRCTDETGYVNHTRATQMAESETDVYLLRKAKGEDISPPIPIGESRRLLSDRTKKARLEKEKAERTPVSKDMVDLAEFGDAANAEIDPVRDLTWIYNHIGVKDVKPGDAPSPGAYAHLLFIQQKDLNKVDFFTKVYPRIIPSKTQVENMTKRHDDGRKHFELLDRLSEESKGDTGQVPVL